jgi:hypothetical protein
MNYQQIFDRLWKNYSSQNPSVQEVFDLFVQNGEQPLNDHIAFRTFNDPRIGIGKLARVFLEAGYVEKGEYHFEEKKLFAKHYEHSTDRDAPRVFISELKLEEFGEELQALARACVDSIPEELLDSPELIFSGVQWGVPEFAVYEKLRAQSEYAGWFYANGFCANHFTVSINSLRSMKTVEEVNEFLKKNNFLINQAGGEVKGMPAELLQQSSTKAGFIQAKFAEGVFEIPGCYYEFALRYPDENGQLYNGFIAKSADKIFESTDFYNK